MMTIYEIYNPSPLVLTRTLNLILMIIYIRFVIRDEPGNPRNVMMLYSSVLYTQICIHRYTYIHMCQLFIHVHTYIYLVNYVYKLFRFVIPDDPGSPRNGMMP
jgi:hypothetical protein